MGKYLKGALFFILLLPSGLAFSQHAHDKTDLEEMLNACEEKMRSRYNNIAQIKKTEDFGCSKEVEAKNKRLKMREKKRNPTSSLNNPN